ncbi:MAG: hypothetical protein AUJ47_04720 [Candidatus Marinimicrobia bacterium CG1_02_48_14]|nr:MAG: hypothetical protein AUJ47_04720 [Candidatus Marinimicrobia bacterium CG1_02_48_14]PIZ69060.1 MAG: hypothetical protein COY19_02710 [Candidatus Marinimicrobia bacterium CG_4_10_14_0_2_um_filter_48_9]PJA53946.1 MAG: hypothetical protein CO167_06550 [Candidatus Marinimicrobia bacterium CG_4_9_14_3_um_filter_48_9]
MKKAFPLLLMIILPILGFSQNLVVSPDVELADYDIIYLMDFDFDNGQNNPLIFQYRLMNQSTTPMPLIRINFSLDAYIPSMDIDGDNNYDQTFKSIFVISTYVDTLFGSSNVTVSSRDLDLNAGDREVRDSQNHIIHFVNTEIQQNFDTGRQNEIISTILALGRVPAGQYRFNVSVAENNGNEVYNQDKTIVIQNPSSIELISPADGYEFIGDLNPVFQWSSTGCDHFLIRVCEYDTRVHSSPDDAIQSESVFPFPDNGGFADLGSANQLDYSSAGGRPLEYGKSYAWRVQKLCSTIGADEALYSDIYTFTVNDAGQPLSQCLQQIRNVLGDNQFNAFFGPNGPLNGYVDCGGFILDGNPISADEFGNLLLQFAGGVYTIESITTQ